MCVEGVLAALDTHRYTFGLNDLTVCFGAPNRPFLSSTNNTIVSVFSFFHPMLADCSTLLLSPLCWRIISRYFFYSARVPPDFFPLTVSFVAANQWKHSVRSGLFYWILSATCKQESPVATHSCHWISSSIHSPSSSLSFLSITVRSILI